jgi:hypothetical protein
LGGQTKRRKKKMDNEQREREFAESVLAENAVLMEFLMERVRRYATAGQASELYILTSAIIDSLKLAQATSKTALGIDQGKAN